MRMTAASDKVLTSPWWLVLLEGIAAVITGILLLIAPGTTTLVLVQVLGFYWFFFGVMELASLCVDRTLWGWKLFSGIIGILAGLVIIRHPLWSALLVPAFLILFMASVAIVEGIVKLIQFFQGGGAGAAVLGVLGLILGIILFSAPVIAAFFLPFVVGIFALIGGVAAIVAAFQLRSAPSPAGETPAMPNF